MHQEHILKPRQFTHYSWSSLTTLAISRLPCAAVWTRPSLQDNPGYFRFTRYGGGQFRWLFRLERECLIRLAARGLYQYSYLGECLHPVIGSVKAPWGQPFIGWPFFNAPVRFTLIGCKQSCRWDKFCDCFIQARDNQYIHAHLHRKTYSNHIRLTLHPVEIAPPSRG